MEELIVKDEQSKSLIKKNSDKKTKLFTRRELKQKEKWLNKLNKSLHFLNKEDRQDFLNNYEEMINDKKYDGMEMFEIFNSMEPIEFIANSIYQEFEVENENVVKPKNLFIVFMSGWWKILLELFNAIFLVTSAAILIAAGIIVFTSIVLPITGVWAFFILEPLQASGILILLMFLFPFYLILSWIIFSTTWLILRESIVFSIKIFDGENENIKKIKNINFFKTFKNAKPKIWVPILFIWIIVSGAASTIAIIPKRSILNPLTTFLQSDKPLDAIKEIGKEENWENTSNNEITFMPTNNYDTIYLDNPITSWEVSEEIQGNEFSITEFSHFKKGFYYKLNLTENGNLTEKPNKWEMYLFNWPLLTHTYKIKVGKDFDLKIKWSTITINPEDIKENIEM